MPDNSQWFDYMSQREKAAGLPAGTLRGVWQQETSGSVNPNDWTGETITSGPRKGQRASGPFQFMPDEAKKYGVNTGSIQSSIDGAARYLGELYKQSGGNLDEALHSYYGRGVPQRGQPTGQQYISGVKSKMVQETKTQAGNDDI